MNTTKKIIKFFIYIWIVIPITKGIAVNIFGRGFGNTISVPLIIAAIYYLEKRKIITKLIDKGLRALNFDRQQPLQVSSMQSIVRGNGIITNDDEVTKSCPNCGAIVTLNGGKGTCASCDTIFS